MIKENQTLLNRLHVLSDGLIVYASLPAAFYLRFYVMEGGIVGVPLSDHLILGLAMMVIELITFAAFGLYRSYRGKRLGVEIKRLLFASLIDAAILLSILFINREMYYSRIALALSFVISTVLLISKRIAMRTFLRRMRERGYNQKHVLLIGDGVMAKRYLNEVISDKQLGYCVDGVVAQVGIEGVGFLGNYDQLDEILEKLNPDEAVCAISPEEYSNLPGIINACESAGIRLSIIPFYVQYVKSKTQYDSVNEIPLLHIRHIPLENWFKAFLKRAFDVVCSSILLLLCFPLLLVCGIVIKLTSPGKVIFRQQRVGLNNKPYEMYKLRTMHVNSEEDTGWSAQTDSRRTKFGSFLRKFSIDELPQLWNVLKGDMSLVGPRPEIPHYVEKFKKEIPQYMVKHQVRPGITGLAQVNGFRGDTSIGARIEYDINYIENWSFGLDLKILWLTVFGGKFINDEKLTPKYSEKSGSYQFGDMA